MASVALGVWALAPWLVCDRRRTTYVARNRFDPALPVVPAVDCPTTRRAIPGSPSTAARHRFRCRHQQAIAGQVQIGASDAYMSDEQAARNPEIINIPLAISAQTVNYNLPGLNAGR